MFNLDLGDGVELRMLKIHHATDFLEMVTENRDYFGKWLGWAYSIDTVANAESFLRRGLSIFAKDGIPWIGIWQDERMVGGMHFFPLERQIRATKIGYWLAQSVTGRGLMTRAIESVLPFLFEELQINRLALEAEPGNLKSKRVAERLGFTFEGVRRHGLKNNGKIVDVAIYSLLKEDWQAGNEDYKYAFGAQDQRIIHIKVKDKNCQQQQLDIRTIPLAFELTVKAHRANQLTSAEEGYRQILEVQPHHPEALYGLGVLMRQKGEYQAAKDLWTNLLEIQPNSIKALFSLGNLYQIQGQLSPAIEAYNRVLTLDPKAIAVYNNLGYALQQQGKWQDAVNCYQKALELQPDCIEAEVNQANALHAQGKLSPEKQAHYAELNNDLGGKCQRLGDFSTAAAYYQQSIAMNPNSAIAHYNLGLVLQAQEVNKVN